jgi:hypothetical protein
MCTVCGCNETDHKHHSCSSIFYVLYACEIVAPLLV